MILPARGSIIPYVDTEVQVFARWVPRPRGLLMAALFWLCASGLAAQEVASASVVPLHGAVSAVPAARAGVFDFDKERDAILDVIRRETEAYYREDFEGWKGMFVTQPYFRQYGYWEGYPDKVVYYDGFAALEAVKRQQFEKSATIWKGSREERKNVNVRIFPEVAWVTFEQESYEGGTDKFLGRSLETRILEKHDGKWKIAYLGFHYFPLEKE